MGQPSRDQASILNDLFPSVQQLTYLFVARRAAQPLTTAPTYDELTPAEIEFITKCERRREHLRSLGDSDAKVQELKETYSWEAFLRELRGYVAKNWESIVGSRGGKPRRTTKKRISTDGPVGIMDLNSMPNMMQQEPPLPLAVQTATPQQIPPQLRSVPTALDEPTSDVHIQEAYERARNAALPPTTVGPAGANVGTPSKVIPPPSPTTATQVTPRATGEGAGNQLRRPWSKVEGTTYQGNVINRLQKQHYSQVSKKSVVPTGQPFSNSTAPAAPSPKLSKTDPKSNSKTRLET
jgi:Telomere repeat binding factor (TRF)